MINDAVQAICLNGGSSVDMPYAQRAATSHFETTDECWTNAGICLDRVKTLYSTISYIYPNRFFCEMLSACKVFAKADRELTRRFSSIHDQIDSIFASFRAANQRGGDPLVCYKMAIHRSVDLMLQTSSEFSSICACVAPRSFGGGWGYLTSGHS